jgi:thiosulfate reductase cytochrome b subunit
MSESSSTTAAATSPAFASAIPPSEASTHPRHAAFVRVTHWLTAVAFICLLVSGLEIVVSHPRFYWGETGNVNTAPLFKIPIPASRHMVPTGYSYTMPDQNGWSRYLHFQAAWLAVITGLVYFAFGLSTGHFRRNLFPRSTDVSLRSLGASCMHHLRFKRPAAEEASSYNVLQRLSYLGIVLVAFPLIIWTGLAMSPAVTSAAPWLATLIGGRQSARTIHFLLTGALVLFLAVHIFMVVFAGFWSRTRPMITGHMPKVKERAHD